MNTLEPTYFTEFKKELFGQLKYRFDGISEQIVDLSERVTTLEIDVKDIKRELKAGRERSDRHSAEILIGIKKLDNHETRIDKIEKEIA